MDSQQLATVMNKFINYNAFVAQLNQHLSCSYFKFAITHLRNTFEEDWESPENGHELPGIHMMLRNFQTAPDHVNARMKGLLRTAAVRVSSMWIVHNAPLIYADIVSKPVEIGGPYCPACWIRKGQIFQGDVFGRRRWDFWKESFKETVRESAVDSYLGKEAGDAVRAMDAVDGSDSSATV